VSLDDEPGLEPSTAEPSDAFDTTWASELLAEALKRMQAECTASARPDVWGVFENRILAPILHQGEAMPYEQLVQRYALASPAQASNVLITAKRMFVRVLRSLIAEYEPDEAQIDAEIADLQQALSQARR